MEIAPTEFVFSTSPFVVRRRVRWGECDPAGVVYTARFTDYLISAVMLFHEQMFEEPPDQFCRRYGIDYPCKALAMTFHRALWPDETFDMHVAVGEIRDSRYDVNVNASLPDGTAVFSGIVSPVCISRGERRAIAIPEVMLLRLHASKVQI